MDCRGIADLATIGKASPARRLGGGERGADPLDGRPAGVEPAVLDARDVGLGDAGSLRQLGLSPAQLGATLANRIAWMVQFGKCGPCRHVAKCMWNATSAERRGTVAVNDATRERQQAPEGTW